MENEIKFFDIDAAAIVERLITGVENEIQEPLYPGDERRIFLEGLSVVLVGMINEINDQCKQRLLKYARNEVLDALGERSLTPRLSAQPAATTLRFSLAEAREKQTYISQGTRATPDGTVHFATIQAATIEPGNLYIDIPAECTTGGAAYNGFTAGTITTITDSVPYIAGVTNTTTTSGGDDGEPADNGGPGDTRYRERIRLAPAKYSNAGSEAGYQYWALSANSLITDVKTPADHDAGTVDIIVMTADGNPTEGILDDVKKVCNAYNIRTMNDLLNVTGPTRQKYDINIKYYCKADQEAACTATIEGAGGSIDQFNAWQQAALGRDINPDKLRALCLAPGWEDNLTGCLRLEVTAPTFKELTERELAEFSGNITVAHAIVEE